jgi:hypothetical protein
MDGDGQVGTNGTYYSQTFCNPQELSAFCATAIRGPRHSRTGIGLLVRRRLNPPFVGLCLMEIDNSNVPLLFRPVLLTTYLPTRYTFLRRRQKRNESFNGEFAMPRAASYGVSE